MKKSLGQRIIAGVLSAAMMVTMLPVRALAVGTAVSQPKIVKLQTHSAIDTSMTDGMYVGETTVIQFAWNDTVSNGSIRVYDSDGALLGPVYAARYSQHVTGSLATGYTSKGLDMNAIYSAAVNGAYAAQNRSIFMAQDGSGGSASGGGDGSESIMSLFPTLNTAGISGAGVNFLSLSAVPISIPELSESDSVAQPLSDPTTNGEEAEQTDEPSDEQPIPNETVPEATEEPADTEPAPQPTEEPEATPVPEVTATPEPTAEATATPQPTAEATATPTSAPEATATPAPTETPDDSATVATPEEAEPEPTAEPENTLTPEEIRQYVIDAYQIPEEDTGYLTPDDIAVYALGLGLTLPEDFYEYFAAQTPNAMAASNSSGFIYNFYGWRGQYYDTATQRAVYLQPGIYSLRISDGTTTRTIRFRVMGEPGTVIEGSGPNGEITEEDIAEQQYKYLLYYPAAKNGSAGHLL